ncbi:response regulator transcription factor [Roseibium sp.]|uniref:helix-turn-helix transcriptional regulator n=1 Tax=Roseibium sp. TaxID=1936156 RepID=UPI003BAB13A0
MDRVFLEAAREIETTARVDQVWHLFCEAIGSVGLTHAIYLTDTDSRPADLRILSTLPGNWPQRRLQQGQFNEPFLYHCCATFEITKVGVEFLGDHEDYLDDEHRSYVTQMTSYGWRAGLGIPCRLLGTGRHGGFIIGNALTAFAFERKILPLASQLQSFCLIAHRRLELLQSLETDAQNRKPLSPREYQTLELISTGIRPKQIAHELQVSEASVRLYLKNARQKLGAETRDEAVALFLQTEKRAPDRSA